MYPFLSSTSAKQVLLLPTVPSTRVHLIQPLVHLYNWIVKGKITANHSNLSSHVTSAVVIISCAICYTQLNQYNKNNKNKSYHMKWYTSKCVTPQMLKLHPGTCTSAYFHSSGTTVVYKRQSATVMFSAVLSQKNKWQLFQRCLPAFIIGFKRWES